MRTRAFIALCALVGAHPIHAQQCDVQDIRATWTPVTETVFGAPLDDPDAIFRIKFQYEDTMLDTVIDPVEGTTVRTACIAPDVQECAVDAISSAQCNSGLIECANGVNDAGELLIENLPRPGRVLQIGYVVTSPVGDPPARLFSDPSDVAPVEVVCRPMRPARPEDLAAVAE